MNPSSTQSKWTYCPSGESKAFEMTSILLPHIIEYNSEINLYSRSKSSYAPCVQKYCNMARILGVNNLNEVVTVHALINQVRFMATEMHMPTRVSEALPKLTKEEYDRLLTAAREGFLAQCVMETAEDGTAVLHTVSRDPEAEPGSGTELQLWFQADTHALLRGEISQDGFTVIQCVFRDFSME